MFNESTIVENPPLRSKRGIDIIRHMHTPNEPIYRAYREVTEEDLMQVKIGFELAFYSLLRQHDKWNFDVNLMILYERDRALYR